MLVRIFSCSGRNHSGAARPRSQARSTALRFERLEIRTLMAADANLMAYRPHDRLHQLRPASGAGFARVRSEARTGIRVNGDDDNANGARTTWTTETNRGGDNDLVRVDARGTGSTRLRSTWTGPMARLDERPRSRPPSATAATWPPASHCGSSTQHRRTRWELQPL